jgi:ABC-type multidrug transport system ATPase subunit
MRMFAGPNGSGKSTLKSFLPPALLGVYVNADEIEAGISRQGFLDFSAYEVAATSEEVLPFFTGSEFLRSANSLAAARQVTFTDGRKLELKSDWIPAWFKRTVLDKFKPAP